MKIERNAIHTGTAGLPVILVDLPQQEIVRSITRAMKAGLMLSVEDAEGRLYSLWPATVTFIEQVEMIDTLGGAGNDTEIGMKT